MTSPSRRRTRPPASPCSSTSRAPRICLLTRSSCSTLAKVRSRATCLHQRTPAPAPQRLPLLLPRSPDSSPMGAQHCCAPLAQAADVFSSSHHWHSGKSWPLPSVLFSPCSFSWKLSREQGFRLFRSDATIPLASIFPLWRTCSRVHPLRSPALSLVGRFLAPFCRLLFRAGSAGARSTSRANHFLSHLAWHAFRGRSQEQCSPEPLG